MSESSQQPEGEMDVSIANLNEQISNRINEYLAFIDTKPDTDLYATLQEAIVDIIATATVLYLAIDRMEQ